MQPNSRSLLAAAIAAILSGATVQAVAQEAAAADSAAAAKPEEAEEKSAADVAELSTMQVVEDPLRALSNEPSASSFGFVKPLLETPRTVSFVSEEQISLFGVSAVEDLMRVVPGTYTTTRYGLQGGINVRGVSADMYYRGMKRLNMQGHVRTVLSAMDGIEVVKGPPSPIYGMGKIGGYTNLTPKSSRAKTGTYLPGTSGFYQLAGGAYGRLEGQLGVGGPVSMGSKQAGFYGFLMFEDSDTYIKQVGVQQRFGQITMSVENFVGPFRLEAGGQAQNSITSGAYMNRVTQALVDNGDYVSGQPMVNMDVNGDGMIGYVEQYQASPVRGNLSAGNLTLSQRYTWQRDPAGNLVPFDSFAKVPGIPATMLAYLQAHPEINCRAAEVMRSMPAGGPLPTSGQLPVGFALDPCTVQVVKVDYRRNGAFEREQNAVQRLGYIDLVYDVNPDFTVKNQMFYDNIDSFKDSWLPYGENQYIKTIENKFTVTKRIPDSWLPDFLRINSLASANYRRTSGWIRSSGGDFDYRQDVMFNNGISYPNTKFWTQYSNDTYATGTPASSERWSTFDERGVGLMFDIDLFRKMNLLLGARYDKSHVEAQDEPPFNPQVGTSANPGRFIPPGPVVKGSDSGKSWSASFSYQLPFGFRPYFTMANSSLTLDGSNNIVQASVVPAGHIGEAELKEAGLKGSFFGGKLIWTSAAYEQTRTDVATADDPTAGAEVSSTLARGVETEIKWVPIRDLYLSVYGLWQKSEYTVDTTANIEVNGRQIGFQDVLDPLTGAVLFPAEAFLYGGRASVTLPAGQPQFRAKTTDPERQFGMSGTYQLKNGFGMLFNVTYSAEVYADRVKAILLPEALVGNVGVTYDRGQWHVKGNAYNVTDERYFRGRSSDTNSQLMSVMPGRRWELTVKKDF
ncbi:MAG TPA: TonB-dependent receptor [Steroidobacteraceae bacterium]|nr:TonB-dependent receptor [Steroidobacteraceae bacterium]